MSQLRKNKKSKGVNRLKKNIKFLIVLLIVVFLYSTVNVYAEEVNTTPTSNETEETNASWWHTVFGTGY